MKKIIALLIVLTMAFSAVNVLAEGVSANIAAYEVYINGIKLAPTSDSPFLEVNGRTYLPMRLLAESLSITVDWKEGQPSMAIVGFPAEDVVKAVNSTKTAFKNLSERLDEEGNLKVQPLIEETAVNPATNAVYTAEELEAENAKITDANNAVKKAVKDAYVAIVSAKADIENYNTSYGLSNTWRSFYAQYSTLYGYVAKFDYAEFAKNYDEKNLPAVTAKILSEEMNPKKNSSTTTANEIITKLYDAYNNETIRTQKLTVIFEDYNNAYSGSAEWVSLKYDFLTKDYESFEKDMESFFKSLVEVSSASLINTLNSIDATNRQEGLMYTYNGFFESSQFDKWTKLYDAYKTNSADFAALKDEFCEIINEKNAVDFIKNTIWNNGFRFLQIEAENVEFPENEQEKFKTAYPEEETYSRKVVEDKLTSENNRMIFYNILFENSTVLQPEWSKFYTSYGDIFKKVGTNYTGADFNAASLRNSISALMGTVGE